MPDANAVELLFQLRTDAGDQLEIVGDATTRLLYKLGHFSFWTLRPCGSFRLRRSKRGDACEGEAAGADQLFFKILDTAFEVAIAPA